jgi:hypothetical protein
MVFWEVSLIYGCVWVVATIVLGQYVHAKTQDPGQKQPNRCMTWGLTFFAVFLMYSFWCCCYMHQKHPLITPIIEADAQAMIYSYLQLNPQ